MLKKVILIFLLCTLQFQFYHSRYVLIDVYDKDNEPRGAGCRDWCFGPIRPCTGDPRCPYCVRYNYCDSTDPPPPSELEHLNF